jgi:hypothetical protein
MRARTAAGAWIFGAMVCVTYAETDDDAFDPVPADLLEFLAEWQDEDGELIDPLMLDSAPSDAQGKINE